jgi:hypothetical protein
VTITDHSTDMIHRNYPEQQAAVRRRLDQIWAAAARDFLVLESFHIYGPKFTSFENGAPRGDAADERAMFSVGGSGCRHA